MGKHLQIVCALACVVFGMLLIGFAVAVEPRGEIHNSVLIAYGETLTFAGSVLGIDFHYRYKR